MTLQSATRRSAAIRRARLKAFTLLELIASVAASSMLLAGLGSTLYVTFRATDTASITPQAAATAMAVEEMLDDLRYATVVVERGAQAVEFHVPDRNDDQIPEAIRYQWSGTAADPLVRLYNGVASDLIPNVGSFSLSYVLKPIGEPAVVSGESPELVLFREQGRTGLSDMSLSGTRWVGQHLGPTLPADALGWKINRVRIPLRNSGIVDGVGSIQLRLSDASGYPTGGVLAEEAIYETTLTPEYQWREYIFDNPPLIPAGSGACLVVRHFLGIGSSTVQYRQSGASGSGGHLVTSTNGGASWSSPGGQSLQLEVYGVVTTSGPPPTDLRQGLEEVAIVLEAGDAPAATVEGRVRLLNLPEAEGP